MNAHRYATPAARQGLHRRLAPQTGAIATSPAKANRPVRPLVIVCLGLLLLALCAPTRAAAPESLVFVFQKQKDPTEIQASADALAELLRQELGIPVRVVVPGDYAASVQALVAGKADFAYVSAMPFLLARRDGGATLLLAEQRTDPAGTPRTDYDSIFVVRADSPLKSLDDLIARARETRVSFTSATSTSGFVVPCARLVREGLLSPRQDPREVFKEVSFAGGYTQALQQVIAGRADVAAVSDYTMEGPRADVYLKADERSKLRVLARTPGVPTHLICARAGLSDDLKNRVKAAVQKIAREKPALLADVYGASAFVEVDERRHVAGAVEAIEAVGIPVEGLAR
jgi:phosphonate transport system substrate-binding protein